MKKMSKVSALFLITVIMFQCSSKTGIAEVLTVADFKAKLEMVGLDAVILDVRTSDEIELGIIPGATQIDFYQNEFKVALEKLDKTVPYFVYCGSGIRSAKTVALMSDLGFNEIYDLKGGIKAWSKAGEPVD